MNNIHLHIIGSKTFTSLLNELDFDYSITSGENLSYNNRDFLVKIIFVEALQLSEVKKYLSENIPTFFLSNNKNFFIKNKLSLSQFHVSLSMPIEVLSFKEILNILVTKYNFFKKSKIIINSYEIDSNQRLITKNNIKVNNNKEYYY